MSTVLVTGGAGFIGSHLAKRLIDQGHIVWILDDLSGGSLDNLGCGNIVVGSILDTKLIDDLFSEYKFDYVYHLAAYAAEGLSHFIKRFNYTNNLIGSVNLINASVNHGVKCFVFTSSMAVYGSLPAPFRESQTPSPEDSYGIAKYAVEQELKISHELFGLDYVIFRPHNVIGTHQNIGDKYRNVVGIFMNQIMRGEPITIFGDGEQRRAFSFVQDIVPAIASAPEVPLAINKVFNIGSDEYFTINQIARAVCRVMRSPNHPVFNLPSRVEVRDAYSDHTELNRVFGKQPRTELCYGLKQMAEWAKSVGPRKSKEFAEIEIEKNLPPSWRKA